MFKKVNVKILILFCVIIGFHNLTYSQSASNIKGKVVDIDSNKEISDVTIIINPDNTITISDKNGNFIFPEINKGSYTLTFTHISYSEKIEKIEINENETLVLKIYLKRNIKNLNEFEIIKLSEENNHPIKIESISKFELLKSPNQDIAKTLQSKPNISVIRKGGTNVDPVMRGFKSTQLNVTIDGGVRIEGGCPNRMDPAISHVDINDVEKIEILKGPYALKYGTNFGGVINIIRKKSPKNLKFKTAVTAIKRFESNWNGNKDHLSIKGGNKDFFFILSGNKSKYGNYKTGDGEKISSELNKYNYSTTAGFSPFKNHDINLSFGRSYGRNISFPALPMDERTDDTKVYSLNYSGNFNNKTLKKIDFKVYHSEVDHVMDNKNRSFSDTVVAISVINAKNFGYRASTDLNIGKGNLIFGTDFENITKDGDRDKYFILQPNLPVKNEKLWDDAWISNFGIFTEYSQKFNNTNLTFSMRLDRNTASSNVLELNNMMGIPMYLNSDVDSEFTNFSFSAGANQNLSKEISVGFAFGRGVRSPDMTERYIILLPIGYDDYDYLGNPELQPEANNELDLELKYKNEKRGNAIFSTFFSYVSDYISAESVPPSIIKPQTAWVVGVKKFINLDYVYLYGFEFSYSSPLINNFGFNVNASITKGINPSATKYIIENNQVVGQEVLKNDPLQEIPPFESNLIAYYKFFDNRIIPEFDLRLVASQNNFSEAFEEQKTPGFIIAGFKCNFKYNDNLQIITGVNNIFDKAYYEHLNRKIIGSSQALYEPGRVVYINLVFNI